MKKITTTLLLILAVCSISFAQHGSADQKSAFRTVSNIEKQIIADNSDSTAVRLIKEHKQTKMTMQSRLSKVEGYGKIKKDKPSIDKFKIKAIKKDSRFAAMNEKEKVANKAKKDYIASIDPKYKAALPKAFPK